jgi:hypothetical protein
MRHFTPPEAYDEPTTQLPHRAYGKLDHTEPELAVPSLSVLVAFDVVDAEQLDQYLDLNDPISTKEFWRRYWSDLQVKPPLWLPGDRLEDLDLYRVEMVFDRSDPLLALLLGTDADAAGGENGATASDAPSGIGRWFEFRFGAGCWSPAEVYPRMFGPPTLTFANFKPTPPKVAKSLSESFSLDHLPRATWSDVDAVLRPVGADSLAVYDVGQGSASALLSADGPTLFFDLGCGVYRNAGTTPHQLRFCPQTGCPVGSPGRPTVILSHWDADHWAGVFADPANYQFLGGDWIVPYQDAGSPGIPHIGLVHDILRRGGTLWIYDPPPGQVDKVYLPDGRQLNLIRATGKSRNDSGFVLCIDDVLTRSWLLTGDAGYDCFLDLLDDRTYEACVVPHHGATLSSPTPVAKPFETKRLVFSYGPNNAHGRNGRIHPTKGTVESYRVATWSVDPWEFVTEPGHRKGTRDIRSTSLNGPSCKHLGGVFIEWGLPGRPHSGCGGSQCTVTLTQFR